MSTKDSLLFIYGLITRIHSLGCCHIGGVAYCVWALPPNAGGAAHRHVQTHSRHVEDPTVADAVIETQKCLLKKAFRQRPRGFLRESDQKQPGLDRRRIIA